MKYLFKTIRILALGAIFFILDMRLGLSDWCTWVVWGLTYVAMFSDYMYNIYGGYKNK